MTIPIQTDLTVIEPSFSGGEAVKVLSPSECQVAARLRDAHPDIVHAYTECVSYIKQVSGMHFGLCTLIRKSHLKGSEIVILLASLGCSQVRISEFRRVAEAPPPLWKQYETKALGFKAVLRIARASSPKTSSRKGKPVASLLPIRVRQPVLVALESLKPGLYYLDTSNDVVTVSGEVRVAAKVAKKS